MQLVQRIGIVLAPSIDARPCASIVARAVGIDATEQPLLRAVRVAERLRVERTKPKRLATRPCCTTVGAVQHDRAIAARACGHDVRCARTRQHHTSGCNKSGKGAHLNRRPRCIWCNRRKRVGIIQPYMLRTVRPHMCIAIDPRHALEALRRINTAIPHTSRRPQRIVPFGTNRVKFHTSATHACRCVIEPAPALHLCKPRRLRPFLCE